MDFTRKVVRINEARVRLDDAIRTINILDADLSQAAPIIREAGRENLDSIGNLLTKLKNTAANLRVELLEVENGLYVKNGEG